MRLGWIRVAGAVLAWTTMTGCGSGPAADAAPADRMAFMVMSAGGMVPAVLYTMQSPSLAVYGDGRVLTGVAAPALQLVPARYQVAHVDPATIRDFLAAARSGGLFDGGTDFGTPRVTDLPTTTVMVDGSTVRVYALDERFDTGLSPAQRDARARLRALIERASGLSGGAPLEAFVPSRIVVSEPRPGRNEDPAVTPWPGPPPAAFLTPTGTGRAIACGELTGTDAAAVYTAALDNPGARWLVDGATRVLAVNPLPVEGCQ